MKVWLLRVPGLLRWNVADTDPVRFAVNVFEGAWLLHPLATRTAFPQLNDRSDVMRIVDGPIHVLTNTVVLAVPAGADPEALHEAVQSWLRLLRLLTRQAGLPTEVMGYSEAEVDEASLQIEWPTRWPTGTIFGAYMLKTALTRGHLEQALPLTEELVPLADELLLDALLAYEQRRHREAILFSAIAIESIAKQKLTKVIADAIASGQRPEHLNIVELPLAGDKKAIKEPIFALLAGDNFQRLLHEAPLYVLRKSLLVEKPELYQHARELYGTRNRLSHGQALTEEDAAKLVPVDRAGAKRALETAVAVFDWFGTTGFVVPEHSQTADFA
jgi:hypothetical protein